MFQNQDDGTALRKDVEVNLKYKEDEHTVKQRELKFDNRALKVQLKEQEVNHTEYGFALKSDYDKKMTLLRQGIISNSGLISRI
jgi:hypothetical protein